MKIDLLPFVQALKRGDLKGAKEWLESKKAETDADDEFWSGYFLALGGMLSALESSQELSLIRKLMGGCNEEEIKKLTREIKKQFSLKFRPLDEKGFNKAWLEFLESFSSA